MEEIDTLPDTMVFAALVLLALRALLCVALRCLAFVLYVPVGMS